MTDRAKKKVTPDIGPNDLAVYSITQFCRRYCMSRSLFYTLKSKGQAPVFFYAGDKPLISRRAAEKWVEDMEKMGATS